jgi:hypothetical protein
MHERSECKPGAKRKRGSAQPEEEKSRRGSAQPEETAQQVSNV